jgi:hypothetical protein
LEAVSPVDSGGAGLESGVHLLIVLHLLIHVSFLLTLVLTEVKKVLFRLLCSFVALSLLYKLEEALFEAEFFALIRVGAVFIHLISYSVLVYYDGLPVEMLTAELGVILEELEIFQLFFAIVLRSGLEIMVLGFTAFLLDRCVKPKSFLFATGEPTKIKQNSTYTPLLDP